MKGKNYRIRKNSIADYGVRAWNAIDREPLATIAMCVIGLAAGMLFALELNAVYPLEP